jgi:predicted acyltransferase
MSTVWLMLLIGLNAFASAHKIDFLDHASLYVWPFGNGAMSAVVMAGVCTSHIFIGTGKRPKPARAIGVGIVFAAALLIAGWLLTPLGISKIRATPTWALCSSGTSVLIFAILFWICDVRKVTKWSFFLRPAGSNALTTYLLPDLWYFLLLSVGVTYLGTHFNSGTPAVIKTSLFTLLMLALAAALTKAKVRLQL